jgi:hypothetical protein
MAQRGNYKSVSLGNFYSGVASSTIERQEINKYDPSSEEGQQAYYRDLA